LVRIGKYHFINWKLRQILQEIANNHQTIETTNLERIGIFIFYFFCKFGRNWPKNWKFERIEELYSFIENSEEKWQKFGNLHQPSKPINWSKIGNFSLLLQIQENLPNSQNHKLWTDWKILFFYCKFGKIWQKIEKTHQTLEIQSFAFILSWLNLVVFATFLILQN
jgi:hypothetical protein